MDYCIIPICVIIIYLLYHCFKKCEVSCDIIEYQANLERRGHIMNTLQTINLKNIKILDSKIYLYNNENICSVCMEKFEEIIELECNHNFHKECLYIWLTVDINTIRNKKCPLCRNNIQVQI